VVRRSECGSAVVDFVLVLVVLVPLFLGIFQVALVLHVRNTMTVAATEGARYAATADRPLDAGTARAREQVSRVLAGRFARDVTGRELTVDGTPVVEVRIVADVPPLGLWGPAVRVEVAGHAVEETTP
jgi:Flp pilus assembly protein TadG